MSTDDADERRARLQALRERRGQPQGARKDAEPVPEGREKLRRILAERRRAQEGAGPKARGPLRAARRRGGEGEAGLKLERFPRLKQLLAERQGKDAGGEEVTAANSPEEIARYREGLESLADWLEQTLKSTREQLAEVRKWEAAGDDAATPDSSGTV
jgi:hypothetical protein